MVRQASVRSASETALVANSANYDGTIELIGYTIVKSRQLLQQQFASSGGWFDSAHGPAYFLTEDNG
jgi:hypothetical protein